MRTVLETCIPRQSILQGTFNPEIFTAALGPVIQHYKGHGGTIDAIYTDAFAFFRDATYPTEGLRQTVSNVFRRIAGDPSVPSIQRMETAFGGGKTHNLIACVHIAYRGKEIADVTGDILDPQYLPEPNSVTVVGIAGDEIPVNKIRGDRLIPYTLWGELAYQVGGEELYRRVKDEAESFAAPGRHFLETVLADRKVLIMLDELAQYAARLEVAVPNQGADQLAAFLMALNGYAKNHAGIAIVVTLAGAADAFSRQTESLTRLLNKIGSGDIKKDDAVVLAERASQGITSVVMRDATAITPVQANEISAVLAKRLFESIDPSAAQAAVEAYTELYSRNSSMLPEEATNIRFRDRILSNYPFHPTLIDFLNNKLAQAENFQGTRGVLRVLALTIRSIWNKKTPVQVVHVSDIDMQTSAIVNELLGRTGSADLRQVLNADIGSVDTHSLQGGLSNAQRLDRRNPHPDGLPFYEMTWKAVFLNSLVGRSEGKSSKVFGASQKELIFEVSTPLLAPSQVRTALDEISESAFYLRYEDGKYFAHLEPTINSVLAMIRQTIDDRQVSQKLRTVSDSLVQDNYLFRVEHSVKYPQDIPDMVERPTIAVVALDAKEINLKEMFTTRGDGVPRIRQNTVLLLVPKSVKAVGAGNEQMGMFDDKKADEEARTRLEGIARQVLAIKALEDNPQAYGIAPTKLRDPEFVERKSERNMALVTTVNEMYNGFYYANSTGNFERKELRAGAGEGGATILSQIQKILMDAEDLVFADGGRFGTTKLSTLADSFFFKNDDKAVCADLFMHFLNYRGWPILASKQTLETLLREGVGSGNWVAYKRSEDPTDTIPGEFYSQKKPLPITVDLIGGGYSIMTLAGAKKRGWTETDAVPNEKVKAAVREIMQTSGAVTVQDITTAVQTQLSNATEQQVQDIIRDSVQGSGYSLYSGDVHQRSKPGELVSGFTAFSHEIQPDDVLITNAELSERGWLDSTARGIRLDGNDGARKLAPILRRLGSLYTRSGATSTIDSLDISDLKLAGGGTLRIALENVGPTDIKRMDELFAILADITKVTDATEAELRIYNPDENCALVKELKK